MIFENVPAWAARKASPSIAGGDERGGEVPEGWNQVFRSPLTRAIRSSSDFNPESLEDLIALVSGERNTSFRMVVGYWDFAASLVTTGAIDGDAFRAAHNEIVGTFSKIDPFLAEARRLSGEPDFCRHIEAVVLASPEAEAVMARRRAAILAAAKARRAQQEEQ